MEFRNNLLSALPKNDLQTLLPKFIEVSLDRGQELFQAGEPVDRVYFPSNAVLSIATVMLGGEAVESSTVGHESASPLIAALSHQESKSRIFTQIGGAAITLPAAALRRQAAQSPDLSALLMRHMASIMFQAEQGVACNALHDAASRLARWLLMTQDRTGARLLPLTQDYMAVMTGVQRTTISGVANKLKDKGLIRYSRGNVEILDRAALEAFSCECYRAVRGDFDKLTARSV